MAWGPVAWARQHWRSACSGRALLVLDGDQWLCTCCCLPWLSWGNHHHHHHGRTEALGQVACGPAWQSWAGSVWLLPAHCAAVAHQAQTPPTQHAPTLITMLHVSVTHCTSSSGSADVLCSVASSITWSVAAAANSLCVPSIKQHSLQQYFYCPVRIASPHSVTTCCTTPAARHLPAVLCIRSSLALLLQCLPGLDSLHLLRSCTCYVRCIVCTAPL